MAIDTVELALTSTQDEIDDGILDLLPRQGHWGVEEYLWLTDHSNRLIEYTDGYLEFLPMPTDEHQSILATLYGLFLAFVQAQGGKVLFAPLRLSVGDRRFREPDLLLVRDANDPRRKNRYWRGADLVLEVVSPDKPARDLIVKRGEYAEAGIPEYWIVNPEPMTITVLTLVEGQYHEHGVFSRGDQATSVLLSGFQVDTASVFDIR